jgi:hypothetical protein
MKKLSSVLSLLTIFLFSILLGACQTNEIIEEIPDFVQIMVDNSPYFGQRRNEDNITLSRDTRIVVRRGNNASQVVFEETFRQIDRDVTVRYNVDLDLAQAGRDAVGFTIRQQALQGGQAGESITGVAFDPQARPAYHGSYEAFTIDRVPLRTKRLNFRVSTGLQGTNPVRFTVLLPPCPAGQRWNPAVAIPPATTKCVPE